jgi:hypothetical protein
MRIIRIAVYLFCISSVAISQETNDLANHSGNWIYTNNNSSNEWFGERYYQMNLTELQKYHSTTEKLVNYLHQQPVAQNPLGVTLNAQSRAAYDSYDHASKPVKPIERVKAEIYIPFCYLIHSKGKIDFDCTEVSYLKLRTNDESTAYESGMSVDQIADKQAMKRFKEIFSLPKKLLDLGNGVFLYDGYYENRIVVANNNRMLWLPITNREYTQRMLDYYNASFKEGVTPQMVIDALKSEIAVIPPKLMGMPAYINGNTVRPLTQICSLEEDSTAAQLYRINPEYFDPSLPRTSVQLIIITIEGHADDPDFGGTSAHRVWEFIKGLKGGELKKLLDVN